MALITTTATSVITRVPFASPGASSGARNAYPIARVVLDGLATVAAKDAANESLLIFTADLPTKFYYRLAHISARVEGSTILTFGDWEPGMAVQQLEQGAIKHQFALWNDQTWLTSGVLTGLGIKIFDDSITNDFGAWFNPTKSNSQQLINGRVAASFVVRWLDTSADSTPATDVIIRIVVDQFTPDQANAAPLNTSLLTYPS